MLLGDGWNFRQSQNKSSVFLAHLVFPFAYVFDLGGASA